MRANEIVELTDDEVAQKLEEGRRELFNLRFQLATGQLDNPARVSQVRHEIARILTVLRAREILEAEGTYVAATTEEREAALAKLAAEDAVVAEHAAARAAEAEAVHDLEHVAVDDDGLDVDDELEEEEEEA